MMYPFYAPVLSLTYLTIGCIISFFAIASNAHDNDLHVTILHTTDVSSRFEQFDSLGANCTEDKTQKGQCFGGVARRGTAIKKVRNERKDINVLLLDAGDQFVGTWFNYFEGRATSYFMNRLGYDAMTFGNLEFANGLDVLSRFLEDINFDMVSANLNATLQPEFQRLFNKSTILEVDGQKIGLVGYSHEQVNIIAILGDQVFTDPIKALQAEVDSLTLQGVNKIIVISHQWGSIDKDLEVAEKVNGVDVIVGGGQNHFQYKGCAPDVEVPLDSYPIVVTPKDYPENKVLIVHGTVYAKYLGRLNVVFDDEGNVSEWYGNPILLDKNVKEDPELLAEIQDWRQGILNFTDKVLGETRVHLQGSPRGDLTCREGECNLGNLITDAFVWSYVRNFNDVEWNDISVAVILGGAIRDSINKGEILQRHLTDVLPFGGDVTAFNLQGRYIRAMLEHAVSNYPTSGAFLQISGLRVAYNVSRDPYDGRVFDVQVVCTECKVPKYVPLEDERTYRMLGTDFMVSGGDGYDVIKDNAKNITTGPEQVVSIGRYIERHSPIFTGLDGRIKFV